MSCRQWPQPRPDHHPGYTASLPRHDRPARRRCLATPDGSSVRSALGRARCEDRGGSPAVAESFDDSEPPTRQSPRNCALRKALRRSTLPKCSPDHADGPADAGGQANSSKSAAASQPSTDSASSALPGYWTFASLHSRSGGEGPDRGAPFTVKEYQIPGKKASQQSIYQKIQPLSREYDGALPLQPRASSPGRDAVCASAVRAPRG